MGVIALAGITLAISGRWRDYLFHGAAPTQIRSLAVLPVVNLSRDPEQDYFADGITTDLTTDLGQIPGAFVIGRGTAFTYKRKQIGHQYGKKA